MRAGANEFFVWPVPEDAFHAAVRRAAARRETSNSASLSLSNAPVLRREGRRRRDDGRGELGVELRRLRKRPTLILDLKPCFGEAALFLGMRPRFTVLDAIDNLHRLDRDFLRGAGRQAQSEPGGRVRAGRSPVGAADARAIEELFRVLGRAYDYVVVDASNAVNSCTLGALYAADTIFVVVNPDVPSVRNAQRISTACGSSASGVSTCRCCSIAPAHQGVTYSPISSRHSRDPVHHHFPSDYAAVSSALNSGVPLSALQPLGDGQPVQAVHAPNRLPLGEVAEAPIVEKRKSVLSFSW